MKKAAEKLFISPTAVIKQINLLENDLGFTLFIRTRGVELTEAGKSFYYVELFNNCEAYNEVLMVIGNWKYVHPLLKMIPVSWNHCIPFGILYSPEASIQVKDFIESIKKSLSYELKYLKTQNLIILCFLC